MSDPTPAEALARDPDDLAALVAQSEIERTSGRPKLARDLARRAVTAHPVAQEAWMALAQAYRSLGSNGQARDAAARQLQLAPDFWGSYAFAADINDSVAGIGVRFSPGLTQAQQAVRLAPDEPEAHIALGNALMRRGRRRQADAAFAEALRLDPMSTNARNNLALNSRSPMRAASEFASMSAEAPAADLPTHNLRAALGRAMAIAWLVVFIAANVSFRTISSAVRYPSDGSVDAARVVLGIVAAVTTIVIGVLCLRALRGLGDRRRAMLTFVLRTDRLLAAIAVILALIVVLIVAVAVVPHEAWAPLQVIGVLAWLTGLVLVLLRARRMVRDQRSL